MALVLPQLASALTDPLEILAVALGVLALRGAVVGCVRLITGASAREIADEMAAATAASLPTALLAAVAAALYLVLR